VVAGSAGDEGKLSLSGLIGVFSLKQINFFSGGPFPPHIDPPFFSWTNISEFMTFFLSRTRLIGAGGRPFPSFPSLRKFRTLVNFPWPEGLSEFMGLPLSIDPSFSFDISELLPLPRMLVSGL